MPTSIGLLMKEGKACDLCSLFSYKRGLTMIVARGSQVSDRIFGNLSEGILAGGIKRGSLATAVKRKQK